MKHDEFSQLSLLIAWPRIQPSGSGASHQNGIDFYKRLTDAVLGAGMRPLVTFFHWDLPQILEDRGGWPNRDTAARLVDYVEIVIFNNVWFLETALRGATRKPSFTALLSRPWASRAAMKNE
jgi:beta-glucosidase/6-phospho-beta-glucosidase/beta-galactosidase